jgi:hypothetical protein
MASVLQPCGSVGLVALLASTAFVLAAGHAKSAAAQPAAAPTLTELREAWLARGQSLASPEQLMLRFRDHDHGIIGVELVIAAPSRRHVESLKGHCLLRLVDANPDPLDDLVVSFTADTGGKVDYLRGVLGRYPSTVTLLTMRHLLDGYVRDEDRALSRYVLPTSVYSRLRLRASLVDWIQRPKEMKRFGILRNNCSRLLTRCLGRAGVTPDLHEVSFPINIPSYLRKSLVSPYPPLVVPTLRSVRTKAGHESVADCTLLTDAERLRYALETRDIPADVLLRLAAASSATPDPVEAYNLRPLPAAVYQACDDARCAEELAAAGETIWTRALFVRAVLSQRTEIRDLEKRIQGGDFTVESVRHHRLLVTALTEEALAEDP